MSIPAAEVAKKFLKLGERDKAFIDPMKLQKLIYIAHGWCLALLGRPLIQDDVQAWRYGPIVPSLYREYKSFGSHAINIQVRSQDLTSIDSDRELSKLVEEVWDKYKIYSGIQLSDYTHEPGYAWDSMIRQSVPWHSPVIPDSLIADEFIRRSQKHPRH